MRQLPISEIHTKYVKKYNEYMKTRYDEIRYHLGHLSYDISHDQWFKVPSNQTLKNDLLHYIGELRKKLRRFVTMNPSDMRAVIDKIVGHRINKKISVNKIHLPPKTLAIEFKRNVYDFYTKKIKTYKRNNETKFVIKNKKFYEHIVDIMEYEKCKNQIIEIYHKMGLKTCVYCNAQYAIGFSDRSEKHATYEFDHFYDKSEWPCFASSFYNLQPSCGFCNKTKSKNRYHFSLYSCNDNDLDAIKFQLSLEDFAVFWLKPQRNLLKIEIKEGSVECKNISKSRKKKLENEKKLIWDELVKKLHLMGLYQEHVDEIEKALIRVKSNPLSYQNQLRKAYDNQNLQEFMSFHEYLYNFSEKAEDIHKQPLTKVKQDVFNQLSEIASFKKKLGHL